MKAQYTIIRAECLLQGSCLSNVQLPDSIDDKLAMASDAEQVEEKLAAAILSDTGLIQQQQSLGHNCRGHR